MLPTGKRPRSFPASCTARQGAAGILGIGYPEQFGGSHEGDIFAKVAASEELMRCGSGGLVAGLGSLDIGLPPVLKWAKPAVRDRVVPEVLAGEKIMALAVTEPSGGSDVANLKTRAVKEGDFYRVSGSKTFITSGVRADYYTVAVRTGGDGFGGVSLLLIEKGTPGFTVRPLAEEDGLVGLGYRRAVLRQLPGAGGEPDRRGKHGLCRASWPTSRASACRWRSWPT